MGNMSVITAIYVNKNAVQFIPSEAHQDPGLGERKGIGDANGGTMYTTDFQAAVSKVDFKLQNNGNNAQLVMDWWNNGRANTVKVQALDNDGNKYTYTYNNCFMTKSPVLQGGASGSDITVVFNGDQGVLGNA